MAFRSAGYWDVTAELDASVSDPQAQPPTFIAKLNSVDGKRVATGRDFDSLGELKKPDEVLVLDEARAGALATGLRGAQLAVSSVEQKPYTRRPYAPFMTSTLQQEAGRKLRFSSERTMSIAQRLYENGYITYMRTDSTTLSGSAINAARNQARQLYGEEYVHPTPRQYTRKVKNAQEAHEAIRPAGDVFQTPGQLHSQLDTDEFRLYELIWQRTVASQMADARGTTLSLRISGAARPATSDAGQSTDGQQVVFSASGRTITFAGFLKAYVESLDDQAGGEADDAESRLPNLTEGQRVDAKELTADGHVTTPPARYTEASLIKALEDLGIGRPSTYSSIIKTIQDRGYVHKKGSALVPSWVAFAVTGLLEQHFGRLVDYGFTAAMEDELDEIASGHEQRTVWLNNFYFGGDHGVPESIARSGGLKKLVGVNLEGIDAREVNSIKLFDDEEGPRDLCARRQERSIPRAHRHRRRRRAQTAACEPQRLADAGRADPGVGREAVLHTAGGPPARGRPGDRPRGRRQGRAVRAVCDRGAARTGRARRRCSGEEGQEAHGAQAAYRLTAAVDGPGDGDARGCAEAAVAAPRRRRRPEHG